MLHGIPVAATMMACVIFATGVFMIFVTLACVHILSKWEIRIVGQSIVMMILSVALIAMSILILILGFVGFIN